MIIYYDDHGFISCYHNGDTNRIFHLLRLFLQIESEMKRLLNIISEDQETILQKEKQVGKYLLTKNIPESDLKTGPEKS